MRIKRTLFFTLIIIVIGAGIALLIKSQLAETGEIAKCIYGTRDHLLNVDVSRSIKPRAFAEMQAFFIKYIETFVQYGDILVLGIFSESSEVIWEGRVRSKKDKDEAKKAIRALKLEEGDSNTCFGSLIEMVRKNLENWGDSSHKQVVVAASDGISDPRPGSPYFGKDVNFFHVGNIIDFGGWYLAIVSDEADYQAIRELRKEPTELKSVSIKQQTGLVSEPLVKIVEDIVRGRISFAATQVNLGRVAPNFIPFSWKRQSMILSLESQSPLARQISLTNAELSLTDSKFCIPVVFSPTEMNVAPRSRKLIKATLFIPSDLPCGRYSGTLVLESNAGLNFLDAVPITVSFEKMGWVQSYPWFLPGGIIVIAAVIWTSLIAILTRKRRPINLQICGPAVDEAIVEKLSPGETYPLGGPGSAVRGLNEVVARLWHRGSGRLFLLGEGNEQYQIKVNGRKLGEARLPYHLGELIGISDSAGQHWSISFVESKGAIERPVSMASRIDDDLEERPDFLT